MQLDANTIITAIGILVVALQAGIYRQNAVIHKRIEKRDDEIKALDAKVDHIDNRLVRIETKLDAHT